MEGLGIEIGSEWTSTELGLWATSSWVHKGEHNTMKINQSEGSIVISDSGMYGVSLKS